MDRLDRLNFLSMTEDWNRFEAIIQRQHVEAETDADVAHLLHTIHLDRDRRASFERFRASREFATILRVMSIFGVVPSRRPIVEVGGGGGYLCWAMGQSGFSDVTLVEPNIGYTTGTGYLASLPETGGVVIENSIARWHAGGRIYDTVLTKGCIHHFMNIAFVAAQIRQRMRPGALWFAEREWFAYTPDEVHVALSSHPYCQIFGTYEWPYPANHYVEAFATVGLALKAVIPAGYANDCLGNWSEEPGSPENEAKTAAHDALLAADPAATVRAFWDEIEANRSGLMTYVYTRPQMFVFEKVPV